MDENVYLTREELDSIINNDKLIGKGTEGACFAHGNEIYKVYHNTYESKRMLSTPQKVDEEGVRIFDQDEIRNSLYTTDDHRIIKYTDKEGTKLTVEDGLSRAINKGEKIVNTKLPTKILYVDGKVKGCVYPYHKKTKSIYYAYKKLYKKRLLICKRLIEQVKELVNNNIYPVDLCQKGDNNIFDKSIANVLLDNKNNPIIIDLEGKSTLYSDSYNKKYEEITALSLGTLILEILTREDIQEDLADENIEDVQSYLTDLGLTHEQVELFLDGQFTINDIDEMIKTIENRKR